jgi:hypothetical protein
MSLLCRRRDGRQWRAEPVSSGVDSTLSMSLRRHPIIYRANSPEGNLRVMAVQFVLRLMQLAAAAVAIGFSSPALAATEIMWWHAMSGELGRQVEKLAADFNASQSDYKVVPSYKGNYTETVTAAIFAFRSRSQPAIVQVNEIGTATMMAARGAIYPVFELMRDEQEPFTPRAYLPAVTGYYADVSGNLLSFPFNSSTPIKDLAGIGHCGEEIARSWGGLRLHDVVAVLDQRREFFRFSQPAARDQGQRLWRARRGVALQQSDRGAPCRAARGMAGCEDLRL